MALLWLRLLKGQPQRAWLGGKYQTLREVKITILLYTDYIQTNRPLRKQQVLAFPRAPEEYKLESLGDSIFSQSEMWERLYVCVCAHRHTAAYVHCNLLIPWGLAGLICKWTPLLASLVKEEASTWGRHKPVTQPPFYSFAKNQWRLTTLLGKNACRRWSYSESVLGYLDSNSSHPGP